MVNNLGNYYNYLIYVPWAAFLIKISTAKNPSQ